MKNLFVWVFYIVDKQSEGIQACVIMTTGKKNISKEFSVQAEGLNLQSSGKWNKLWNVSK